MRPNVPEAGTRLCALADVPEDNGLDLVFGPHEPRFRLMLFRQSEGIRAWVNECPHQKVATNIWPDVFCLADDADGRHLVCEHHWAMFRLRDGVCIEGPCEGAALMAVPVHLVDGEVRLGESPTAG